MYFGIRTLDECQLEGKTVLCRVDLNQPIEEGKLKDITRIKASMPTIEELSDSGAKVVLIAHQGSDIEYSNFYTTQPHSEALTELLGKEVQFVDDVCGPTARQAIKNLKNGEILLLDNVRFVSEEQTLFELKLTLTHEQQAKTLVVRKLAPLADLYICDAFAAAHRDQPSLCGFEQVLPSAMGRLFEKEYRVISELMDAPARPCVFVLGGAKIADAFLMMSSVLENGVADHVLTGGLVANILLASYGIDIGKASMDFIIKNNLSDFIDTAKGILEKYRNKIVLPKDLAFIENCTRKEVSIDNLPVSESLVDIGAQTISMYQDIIQKSATVFVNGPMGIFEKPETEAGTKALWQAFAETEAYTVIGGGDSVTACNKYQVQDKMGYVCTGGGALIRFLTGEELPVVRALRHGSLIPFK